MATKPTTTPATYQPTQAAMEEVVSIEGTPEEIAATMFGGVPRRAPAPAERDQPDE